MGVGRLWLGQGNEVAVMPLTAEAQRKRSFAEMLRVMCAPALEGPFKGDSP